MIQDNIGLVQRAYDAFGRGDIGTMLSLLDADVEWTTPGASDLPTSGTRRGSAQVGEFFKILSETLDFDHFEAQSFIADGDRVVVLGVDQVRVKGGSGTPLKEAWCHVFTIRNGKIAAFREYMDTAAFAAEMRTAGARA